MAEHLNRDLLDFPREDERHELKAWFELTRVAKAELAKDLAALSNFGGGFVIMGFEDKTLVAQPTPSTSQLAQFTYDSVGDIIKTFLEPTFNCQVTTEKSTAGSLHTIIQVPSHGVSPVFAKTNAHNEKNHLILAQGVLYIRKPKPESAPISSPLEWLPVVRRCVLADRTGLLTDFGALLDATKQPPASSPSSELHARAQDSLNAFMMRHKKS